MLQTTSFPISNLAKKKISIKPIFTYVMDFDKETPLITETKHFGRYEFKELLDFITTPSKILNLKSTQKRRHYSKSG